MARDNRGGPSLEETLETKVDRRDFLKKAGMTVAAGGLLTTIGACGTGESEATTTQGTSGSATTAATADTAQEAVEVVMTQGGPEIEWEMGTSWPLSLDTIYGGAVDFAQRVSDMTGGRFTI
ncbi:MAG: twin-arginine translocation signal domain-containing protein, partial [bacterium]|nr:twin-arginine translocation signal domain-containing protein [bacterium]